MNVTYTPLHDQVGVRIDGLDPADHQNPEVRQLLLDAIRRYKLVLIKCPGLSTQDQVTFTQILGPINRRGVTMPKETTHAFVSNEVAGGILPDGEIYFHADQTYFDPPLKAIALYGVTIPSQGGDTCFLDATQAYHRLPEAIRQKLVGLKAFHAHDYSGAKYSKATRGQIDLTRDDAVSAIHPVVWEHPTTKEPVLLVNRSQTQYIIGMDPEESQALLKQIYDLVEDPACIYRHQWAPGDLVIWDNWGLQHARAEWDPAEKRTLRRVPIGPDTPTVPASVTEAA